MKRDALAPLVSLLKPRPWDPTHFESTQEVIDSLQASNGGKGHDFIIVDPGVVHPLALDEIVRQVQSRASGKSPYKAVHQFLVSNRLTPEGYETALNAFRQAREAMVAA
jgi:hypothetical protein